MRISFMSILFLTLIHIGYIEGYAQDLNTKGTLTVSCDTLTAKRFEKLLKSSFSLIKTGKDPSEKEMIDLIRVYNTLHFERNNEFDKGIGRKYLVRFRDVYIDKALELMDFKPYKGSWYSEKYDLFISSGYQMKCHNFYFIK